MTVLTNSAEGGPTGIPVSAANSGGASGNAFDAVTINSTCTLAYDTTHAVHGAKAFKYQFGGTPGDVYAQWNTSMGTQSQIWFRFYAYFTGNPGSVTGLWSCSPASGLCGRLQVNTSGNLVFTNQGGTTVLTSTSTIPLNAWFRVEGMLLGSGSNTGQEEFKIFTVPDGTTPAETKTSPANVNTNSASITKYDFGDSGTTVASVGPFWADDLGLSSSGYLGPSLRPRPSSPVAALVAAGIA